LEALPAQDVAGHLIETKERMRKIPRNGIGYGIFKFLTGAGEEAPPAPTRLPGLVFNYLGQFDADISDKAYQVMKGRTGALQNAAAGRTFTLEISGMVAGHQLVLNVAYSKKQYKPETIAALLEAWKEALTGLVRHCLQKESRDYTPGDFRNVDLSVAELNNIFD
ncbi:MAG: hypothetical protein ICV83_21310, partial [Cytophagales bacterium]|nr:hypothetical protein [Cytophagales bacterium]